MNVCVTGTAALSPIVTENKGQMEHYKKQNRTLRDIAQIKEELLKDCMCVWVYLIKN